MFSTEGQYKSVSIIVMKPLNIYYIQHRRKPVSISASAKIWSLEKNKFLTILYFVYEKIYLLISAINLGFLQTKFIAGLKQNIICKAYR